LVALNPLVAEIDRLVSFRAARLRRIFRLGWHDEEDLRQSAWADIVRAAKRHDPRRAPLLAYLRRCLDRWYFSTARSLHATVKRSAIVDHDLLDRVQDGGDPAVTIADRMDAETLLSRLPPHVRTLALAAADASVAEAARKAGVHRGTAHRRLQQARRSLPEFDPKAN
jgi:DNA-directed RNA polymerase specialized sigma24 family protein